MLVADLCPLPLQQQRREKELRKQQEREQRRHYEEQMRREEERRRAEHEQVMWALTLSVCLLLQWEKGPSSHEHSCFVPAFTTGEEMV